MPEPFPISAMSAQDAAFWNSVTGTRRTIRWSMQQTPVELVFEEHGSDQSAMLLHISAGPAQFWIGLSDWDRLPGAREFLQQGHVSSLPPDVLPAVLETLFEEPLDQLSTYASAKLEMLGSGRAAPDVESLTRIPFRIAAGQEPPLDGFLLGDAAAMKFLRYLVELAPAEDVPGSDSLPLAAGIEIGTTELPLSELAHLKLHDVLMLDSTTLDENKPEGLIRFTPTSAWRVSLSKGKAVCLRREENPRPVNMAGQDVSVRIAFEQGRVQCTVDQLAKLAPDDALDVSDAASILLTSNGKPFASGELVRIGDRIGVRLLARPAVVALAEPQERDEAHPMHHREV